MAEPDDGGRAALRAFAVAALALAGFLVSLTPVGSALDDPLLDLQWKLLRKFDPRSAPDDIVIVGIDPASVSAIPEPVALWHDAIGRALARIAATKPRAIALDFPLPDRSYEAIRPGLDRALFAGLSAAAQNGPFVATLNIDPRTRSAKSIHPPFLALLGDARLAIGLLSRDADGVTRRYALMLPTEDGGFPTLEGRLCRELSRRCNDGLIHFALGAPFRYVPLRNVLEMKDAALMERLFRDRVVLIGETQPYGDRVAVPVNLAGWEGPAHDSPAVVVHAQALRTAMQGAAPETASRPLVVLALCFAALVYLLRAWRMALAAAAFGSVIALPSRRPVLSERLDFPHAVAGGSVARGDVPAPLAHPDALIPPVEYSAFALSSIWLRARSPGRRLHSGRGFPPLLRPARRREAKSMPPAF
jgi:CHASE2 domain-containing sensor protein